MKSDLNSLPLILIDTETTGLSPERDRLIEIALVKYQNNRVIDQFSSLINPEQHIPLQIQNGTGITSEMVEKAPVFSEIAEQIHAFIGSGIFVAHNVNFDYGFLRQEFHRLGITFLPPRLCTVQISRHLFPDFTSHSLDSLITNFGFNVEARHRAMGDVLVMKQFIEYINNNFGPEKLSEVIDKLIQTVHVPNHLKDQIARIPNTTGVYFFYDAKGALLYIGKSKHLQDRVKSHFQAMGDRYHAFHTQITDIDFEITAGDLTSQLKEANYIKEKMPIYNRQLRRKQQLYYAIRIKDKNGYERVELVTDPPPPQDIDQVLRIYSSKKQSKDHFQNLVRDFSLCDGLMGLQKTVGGACFSYHLKKCQGACIQEESPESYNARLSEAFNQTMIKAWSYTSPVVICERNEDYALESAHLINHWCYLGSAQSYDDVFSNLDTPLNFDYDTYKIMVTYLSDKKNQSRIMPVTNSEN